MLGSIFHKRKKTQDLRAPTLQDIKRHGLVSCQPCIISL